MEKKTASEEKSMEPRRKPTSGEWVEASVGDFLERRSFLAFLLAIGGALVGGLLSVPLIRFVLHPLLAQTTQLKWSEVGSIDEFKDIVKPVKRVINVEQRDGWRKVVSEKAIYVIRAANGQIKVLSPICPHLGCPVAWSGELNQFKCPCHVGAFSPEGALISGPPPRGMDDLDAKVENGRLLVQYQYFRSLVPKKEPMT
ncbi:MAG: ubiquinol-cytochrome c reductase iron-sulfur subunit [Deltaproteobacteria bacterium]|nr:ubiquinol-cytochrome c reductase iron-sulfur subunit [Deltaproteobacteria bacterium]